MSVGIIEVCQPRPNKEPDDQIVSVPRLVAADLICREFSIAFVFNGNLLAAELSIVWLSHCNRTWIGVETSRS